MASKSTYDDASSTYTTASTVSLLKKKAKNNKLFSFKGKEKASASGSKSKPDPAAEALHNEAVAKYLAFR